MAQTGSLTSMVKPANGLAFTAISRPAFPRSRRSLQPMNAVKEVFMPALSSTMTEGKIVSWLKSPGDKVKKGESIVVVESGALPRNDFLYTFFRFFCICLFDF